MDTKFSSVALWPRYKNCIYLENNIIIFCLSNPPSTWYYVQLWGFFCRLLCNKADNNKLQSPGISVSLSYSIGIWEEWMIGVLGHDSALLRLNWAGDNLGEWDECCYESCLWRRSVRSTCWPVAQRASTIPRMPLGDVERQRLYVFIKPRCDYKYFGNNILDYIFIHYVIRTHEKGNWFF